MIDKALKINVISIFFPPETGAAASRILKMSKAIQDHGSDIEVITALPNYPQGQIFQSYKGKFYKQEQIEGISTHRYWLYPSNSKNVILRIISMFSFSFSIFFSLPYLLKRKPDLLIVNTPPLLTGFAAVILAKLIGAKLISNVSDIWPLSGLELGALKKGAIYTFLEKIEVFIYRKSDGCIGQSEETVKYIAEKVGNEKKIFLYRNLDKISPFADCFPILEGPFKVGYAGLLGVAQGVYEICKNVNFKDLGVEFHIYGAGNEVDAIKRYITENPECNIFLHDVVPKNKVSEILSEIHATIIPLKKSIFGALPSKVYMAIASGLPILFSGNGGGAAIVEQYHLGLVNAPSDYEGLEKNIAHLSQLSEKSYRKFRQNCIETAKGIFAYDKQQDDLIKFVIEIAKD